MIPLPLFGGFLLQGPLGVILRWPDQSTHGWFGRPKAMDELEISEMVSLYD